MNALEGLRGLHRLAAFSTDPSGGNPAGVWFGEELPSASRMQEIAAEVGYSETAFLAPLRSTTEWIVRYYSPLAEVPFCGHATIASAVQLGTGLGEGTYTFHTAVGAVEVEVHTRGGAPHAVLTSVEPKHRSASSELLGDVVEILGWHVGDLDPLIPPAVAYAGAWHLVVAVATADRLARLDYDFDRLKKLMLETDLTTLQLIWREADSIFHARGPFPVGGMVEDPATGAAAAALGGYLRDAALIATPADLTIWQGVAMGRPSQIFVHVPAVGGIRVGGTAVTLQQVEQVVIAR